VYVIGARSGYWENQMVPEHLLGVWEHARALMPLWPGFQRLRISEEQREAIRGCRLSAQDFFDVFEGEGEEVETAEAASGIEKFRIRIDLTDQRLEQDPDEDDRL
jgi:hypothetical protein